MKKVLNKLIKDKLILGIIIGISITSTVVYAAYVEANQISFTSSTGLKSSNVQDAIDEISNKCSSNNSGTTKTYKCKRATILHTSTCQSESGSGCRAADISSGATIKYGNLGTNGTLASGDAFDCDVNGDGIYNASTERFYYVSDYYDTSSKSFNSDVATLIYYSNVSSGNPDKNIISHRYYGTSDSNSYNYYGPKQDSGYAYYHLPSTSQWSNISLYKTTRAILTEAGTTSTGGGTLPSAYDYGDKAARFLTTQELESACNITVGSSATGELDTCKYLMESTFYDDDSVYKLGYWLETPRATGSSRVWVVDGENRTVYHIDAYNATLNGARPVIEVLKSDIDY